MRRQDAMDNEIMVLGAISMALDLGSMSQHGVQHLELIAPEEWTDRAYIDVRLSFMRSPYRITVTMLGDDDE